jgi:S-adenosylmethionine:tRNA ribosyltransferase-isomerase
VKFNTDDATLFKTGETPLPPYINSTAPMQEYQTVYAKDAGSVAAPTAGLHFTKRLITKLKKRGVIIVEITLHVGLGTFQSVKTENIAEHHMHQELANITAKAAQQINKAKRDGKRIIACGTTSVRTLETFATADGTIKAGKTWTNIFIYPGYTFKIVDGIITNFHLPKSSLIMLVSAFLGYQKTMRTYQLAINKKYRFYSFGDAMLIV